MHATHEEQIKRINRIEGQIKGIRRMIEEQRYCIDILMQTKAVSSALRRVEEGILMSHMRHCLKEAASSGSERTVDERIEEIIDLIKKRG
jgi:DNA-binding FrmR family transcriptional regulator